MSTQTDHDLDRPAPSDDGASASRIDIPARPATWRDRPGAIRDQARGLLEPVWRSWRLGTAIAVGAAGVMGAGGGLWTPRGPLTTGQAIWSIVISLFVGVAAGLVMRSRWAMLVGPVAFAAVFELTRIGTDGPTVDMPAFTTYGIFAFVVGRGFHALISLAPMAFGAVIGAGIARHPRRHTRVGRAAPPMGATSTARRCRARRCSGSPGSRCCWPVRRAPTRSSMPTANRSPARSPNSAPSTSTVTTCTS